MRRRSLQLDEDLHSLSKASKLCEEDNLKVSIDKSKVSELAGDYRKKCMDLESKIDQLNDFYEKERSENSFMSKALERKEDEITLLTEAKIKAQRELERTMDLHQATNLDKKILENQVLDKEEKLLLSDKKLREMQSLVDYKDRKESDLKKELTNMEINSIEYKEKLRQVQKDKELYETIAERAKKEAEINKKLRESTIGNKIELIQEKKKLESRLLDTEIEANRAKRDLNLLKETHGDTLEEKIQKEKELQALRQHVDVLGSHNKLLSSELESIAISDEKIKQDLDRRNRIEYIKEKNTQELQKSAEKVRLASPDKSYKSPSLKSPYKSPYKN